VCRGESPTPYYTQELDGRGSIHFRDIEVLFSSVITFIVQTSPGSIFDLSPGRYLVALNIQFLSSIKYSIP
jgi:hypothetical protein